MNNDNFKNASIDLNEYISKNPLHWELECLCDWLSLHDESDSLYKENEDRYFEVQKLIDNGGK